VVVVIIVVLIELMFYQLSSEGEVGKAKARASSVVSK